MTQLKTKIIETPKARVLVVDLPKSAEDLKFLKEDLLYFYTISHNYDRTGNAITIPKGNWQLLGKLDSITEDQWKGIVGSVSILKDKSDERYMNYRFSDEIAYGDCFRTATESGLSLIESECLLKNPHGEKPQYIVEAETESQASEIVDMAMEWQAAEDQVFHNPVIFWEKK